VFASYLGRGASTTMNMLPLPCSQACNRDTPCSSRQKRTFGPNAAMYKHSVRSTGIVERGAQAIAAAGDACCRRKETANYQVIIRPKWPGVLGIQICRCGLLITGE